MSDELPELFARAVELTGAERERLLAALRASDPDGAAELVRLLAASGEEGGSSLDRPPWRALVQGGAIEEEPPPARIGPYRVVRELGRGGMGRVFLATQEGDGFARQVALKIVPAGSGALARRVFREWRILATLEHPGIARFYDAGRAPGGCWFLALEYVAGEDLLGYARARGLDLRARVELFLQVLDAVDFAHRRLVVHRDLKPANVLVGADGRPKLLDFGISKALDPEDGDALTVTHTQLLACTPAYASPEQLRGERATIATDVYSLGVVLYELLAGRRPFATRAAERTGPPPPSVTARELADASEGTTAVRPVRWRDLGGDLDAIILKALRSEVESRYPSAAAFAADLRHWLAGEPVGARRGGRRYRLGKLMARHRLAMGAAAAILLALTVGLWAALVQRSRAVAARQQAEETVADLHRLSQSMLFEIYDQVRDLPSSLAVSGTIVRNATEVLDRLARSAGDDPRLLADLAAGYERLGFLFSAHPALRRSLHRPRAAVDYLERALLLRQRLAARPAAGLAEQLALVETLGSLAEARLDAGDAAGASAATATAIRRLERLLPQASDPLAVRLALAVSHSHAGVRARRARQPAVARHHDAAAARLWLALLASPAELVAAPGFAAEAQNATRLLGQQGELAAALRMSDLGLAAFARGSAERAATGHRLAAKQRLQLLYHRVNVLRGLGRSDEALTAAKELRRDRAALPPDRDELLADLIELLGEAHQSAMAGAEAGDFAFAGGALADAERVLAAAERKFGAPAFASARVEHDWLHADVLARRAAREPSPLRRQRLVAAAREAYAAALQRAEELAASGILHGISHERVDELRHAAERLRHVHPTGAAGSPAGDG